MVGSCWTKAEDKFFLSLLYSAEGPKVPQSKQAWNELAAHMNQGAAELGINQREYTLNALQARHNVMPTDYREQMTEDVLKDMASGRAYWRDFDAMAPWNWNYRSPRSPQQELGLMGIMEFGTDGDRNEKHNNEPRQTQDAYKSPESASGYTNTFGPAIQEYRSTAQMSTVLWTPAEDELLLWLTYSLDGSKVVCMERNWRRIAERMTMQAVELGISNRTYCRLTVYRHHLDNKHTAKTVRDVLQSIAKGNRYGTHLENLRGAPPPGPDTQTGFPGLVEPATKATGPPVGFDLYSDRGGEKFG